MNDTELTFADKFLPVQQEFRKDFDGNDEALLRGLFELVERCSGLRDPEEELEIENTPKFTIPQMGSSPMMLRLLQFLVRLSGAKRVLEIGAFIGVSGMYMAKALPAGGKLTSIEKFDHFAEIARRNHRRNGLGDRIEVIVGDAFEVLKTMGEDGQQFDMVFLDGNKEKYADYFEALDPFLAPGGLFVTDDVFFHGDAVNASPHSEKGEGARRFLDLMAERADYERLLLPLTNGLFLARKPA